MNIEVLENPHFVVVLYSFNTCISIVAGKHLEATLKVIMSVPIQRKCDV